MSRVTASRRAAGSSFFSEQVLERCVVQNRLVQQILQSPVLILATSAAALPTVQARRTSLSSLWDGRLSVTDRQNGEQRDKEGMCIVKIQILVIDLAKNIFQLHGVDRKRRPDWYVGSAAICWGSLEPCLIGIEASTGAFYCFGARFSRGISYCAESGRVDPFASNGWR
jgi:hypothetical protein